MKKDAMMDAPQAGAPANKEKHSCSECPIRAKYDRKPKSLVGRLWRWHIRFCPGWKRFYASLNGEERTALQRKYDLKN